MAKFQQIDESLYKKIHSFVDKRMGLFFSDNRKKDLVRGLNYAAENFGYKDVNTCVEQLLNVSWTTREIQTLANYLTIGETYFYRHREQLEYVFKTFLRKKQSGEKIKIWSAACCSGEEPLSLAILCNEFNYIAGNFRFEIFGTDINPTFLNKAKQGIYTEHSLRTVPESIIRKYFTKTGKNEYTLPDSIREKVQFRYLNLAANTYPSEINNTVDVDIIFCRNVFIYFKQETVTKVVNNFRNCLKKDGLLFVSPAETFMVPHDLMNKVFENSVTVFSKTDINVKKILLNQNRLVNLPKMKSHTMLHDKLQIKQAKINGKSGDVDISSLFTLFKNKQYDKIISISEKIKTGNLKGKAEKEFYFITCRSYANSGNLKKALDISRKLIDADKFDKESYFIKASIELELDRQEDALISLGRILYLDKDYIMAHYMIGNIYMSEGKMDEAVSHFSKAYNLLEKEKSGKILEQSEGLTVSRLMEMISIVLKAQGIKNNNQPMSKKVLKTTSIETVKKDQKISAGQYRHVNNTAYTQTVSGTIKTSAENNKLPAKTSKLQKLDKKKLASLFKSGRYEEIIEITQDIEIKEGNVSVDTSALKIICRTYANMGNLEEALSMCKSLLKTFKLDTDLYFLKASICLEMKNVGEAIKNLHKVLYLNPAYVMAHFMLGNIQLSEGNRINSIKHFRKAYVLLSKINETEVVDFSEGLTAERLKEIIKTLLKSQNADVQPEVF